ncbi:patatin-like phospholipase family protein [Chitinophaga silvatica]|uniref:Patatin-like phospholipase family protein n=1 Tax=Chitinophaga silvatica TaxID=2282649 RepID=A0A3E1YDN7_9BACT|nr:patatin-like phospholipase family protein [Chitinophaga silvatica]RFS24593.1 patatin-like phospholipase family protein [Chitinophaga silvatica]
MAKTALVLCGGGSRAAFAVGALKYIHSQRSPIQFDIFCGTGTSAIIASLAALGEINLLEKLFTSNSTADLLNTSTLLQRFPNSNSLYNTTAFIQKISNIFTDARFNALKESEKEVLIATMGLQTNQITYFTPNEIPVKKGQNIHQTRQITAFRQAVLAACSAPVFMPPVEINSQQYFTGGGQLYKPIEMAIERGATSIYLIQLTPVTSSNKQVFFQDLIDILERQIDLNTVSINEADISTLQLQNKALKYISAVKANLENNGISASDVNKYFEIPENPFEEKLPVDLQIIRPEKALAAALGGLEFSPPVMKEMLEYGQQIAQKILG